MDITIQRNYDAYIKMEYDFEKEKYNIHCTTTSGSIFFVICKGSKPLGS